MKRLSIPAILIVVGLALLTVSLANKWRSKIPVKVSTPITNQLEPKPVKVSIPALKIEAPIVTLGLNADQTLEVPKKSDDVGWFVGSVSPGAVGPAIMVGHLDSTFGPAVFWNLKNLKTDDEILVTREDGSTAIFKVTDKQTYSQDSFPTDQVYGAVNFAALRLITCSGVYSRTKGHYSDNLVVYSKLTEVTKSLTKKGF